MTTTGNLHQNKKLKEKNIEFVIIASPFALPAAALVILSCIVVSDIKSAKKMKRFDALVKKCEEFHGPAFTTKLLRLCTNGTMGVENMITVFESHCNIP